MRILIFFGLLFLFPSLVFSQQFVSPSNNTNETRPLEKEKLQSVLYELARSHDKDKFAKDHNIFLCEGKVKVFLFFDPMSSTSEQEEVLKSYHAAIEKKSDNVARALVSIEEMIPLSKEAVILSISIPAAFQDK